MRVNLISVSAATSGDEVFAGSLRHREIATAEPQSSAFRTSANDGPALIRKSCLCDPQQRPTPFLVEGGHRGSIIRMGLLCEIGKHFAQHDERRAGATAWSVACIERPPVKSGTCLAEVPGGRNQMPATRATAVAARNQYERLSCPDRTCSPGREHELNVLPFPAERGAAGRNQTKIDGVHVASCGPSLRADARAGLRLRLVGYSGEKHRRERSTLKPIRRADLQGRLSDHSRCRLRVRRGRCLL